MQIWQNVYFPAHPPTHTRAQRRRKKLIPINWHIKLDSHKVCFDFGRKRETQHLLPNPRAAVPSSTDNVDCGKRCASTFGGGGWVTLLLPVLPEHTYQVYNPLLLLKLTFTFRISVRPTSVFVSIGHSFYIHTLHLRPQQQSDSNVTKPVPERKPQERKKGPTGRSNANPQPPRECPFNTRALCKSVPNDDWHANS